jgi:hypothetical protein
LRLMTVEISGSLRALKTRSKPRTTRILLRKSETYTHVASASIMTNRSSCMMPRIPLRRVLRIKRCRLSKLPRKLKPSRPRAPRVPRVARPRMTTLKRR